MEAQKTQSNSNTVLLFVISILITILGGTLTGVAVGIVSSLFYIIFLFPLGMGFVGGNIVTLGMRLTKIRKISQVIFLSALVALSIYGTYHFMKYIAFRVQTYAELLPKLTKVSRANKVEAASVLLDYALVEETGHSGFVGYMLYKAQKGVSLEHFYSSDSVNLGPVLTWVYWLLELGIVVWMAMSIAKNEVQVPVCEVCGSRLGKEKHLGGTTPTNESLLLDLIRRREFSEVGKLIEKNEYLPSTELYMQRCEACQKGNSRIMVRRAFQNTRGTVQFTDVLNVTLPPTDSILLSHELRFSN